MAGFSVITYHWYSEELVSLYRVNSRLSVHIQSGYMAVCDRHATFRDLELANLKQLLGWGRISFTSTSCTLTIHPWGVHPWALGQAGIKQDGFVSQPDKPVNNTRWPWASFTDVEYVIAVRLLQTLLWRRASKKHMKSHHHLTYGMFRGCPQAIAGSLQPAAFQLPSLHRPRGCHGRRVQLCLLQKQRPVSMSPRLTRPCRHWQSPTNPPKSQGFLPVHKCLYEWNSLIQSIYNLIHFQASI